MVSLKKESVIMEITPVHLMSEEEADKKFRLSREKSVSGMADGKSVTLSNTAEHIAANSGKSHTKKHKHNRDNRKNDVKTHIVRFFSKTAQNIRIWIGRDCVADVIGTVMKFVIFLFIIVVSVISLAYVISPVEPTLDNLEISTYETSGIYKFTIVDELKVNGSENIYYISIRSIGTVELTESEYEKYLGDNVNAVSVTAYEIRAVANGVGEKQDDYCGKRYDFPWSENVMPFSEEEKAYFAELICVDYKNGNNIMEKLSLDSYNFWT